MIVRPTETVTLPSGPIEYRLERRDGPVVVVFHGGHVRAGLALGEEVYADAGCTVLAPSRPGYGRTPVSTVEAHADVVRMLCAELGIDRVAAAVGVSAGGPTATVMAARHPDLVERLILVSAVGRLPYPGRWTRVGAQVVFAPAIEGLTWAGVRLFARVAPGTCLRTLVGSLTTRPAGVVLAAMRPEERAELLALFTRMRSGRGFRNDLRPVSDVTALITQPALVIATRTDGGVPFTQARSLVDGIRDAELVESRADTHLVWLGDDWPMVAARVRAFLDIGPTRRG